MTSDRTGNEACRLVRKVNRAFTLVELLIVIVVIAILASISVVAYNGLSQRSYTAKASSAIDAYMKLIEMYKVDNGEYPTYTDIGLGNYACLSPVGSLPAAPPFAAGVCESDYGDTISAELNGKLLDYTSSLPSGLLPVVQYNDLPAYARGLSYSSDGTGYQILYYLNGTYECPRGERSSFRADTTECSIDIDP